MAVLDNLPGVTVDIIVDGSPLREYPGEDLRQSSKEAACYVEAVDGKNFAIRVKVEKGTRITREALSCQVEIDGEMVLLSCSTIAVNSVVPTDQQFTLLGRRNGPKSIEKFMFRELETADDDRTMPGEMQRADSMGNIAITIDFGEMVHGGEVKKEAAPIAGHAIVSEKLLKGKAITHGVGYMAAEPNDEYSATRWDFVNRDLDNIFVFNFAYRSRKGLKDLLITESIPETLSLEEREFDSLSRAELVELHQRARDRARAEKASGGATAKVKWERPGDEN